MSKIARVILNSGQLLVSKPGFDAEIATPEQLMLGAGIYPQPIIQRGIVALTAGVTSTVMFGITIPFVPFALIQGTEEGVTNAVTFPALRTNGGSAGIQTSFRSYNNRLVLNTEFSRRVYYIITSAEVPSV